MPSVRVRENEPFEVALRRFKRTIEKTGLLTELRAREFYEKPTAERKRKLAAAERAEIELLQTYMPQQLPEVEVDALIDAAMAAAGAGGMAAMGKIMAALKPQLAGRADMAQVSAKVKARLAG